MSLASPPVHSKVKRISAEKFSGVGLREIPCSLFSTELILNRTFRNPIIPGCYPDPSICRVDEDYYLVTSTFEYFPGLPIFHSRDLVNWQQIGHVLDRPSQLNLDGIKASLGLYAPTIR